MLSLFINSFIGAGLVIALIGLITFLHRGGKNAQKVDDYEQTLDDIHTAKQARDRYNADASERQRMRDKYTKK